MKRISLVSAVCLASLSQASAAVRVVKSPTAPSFIVSAVSASKGAKPAVYTVKRAPVPGGYAVVTSFATNADKEWGKVVRCLAAKHSAPVLVYDGPVESVRPELTRLMPRYTCFVARPSEAGRQFVVSVHRLTRQLNGDPYTDTIWGILTGYSANDALRIAACTAPLTIRRGLGGTGLPLDVFDSGAWFDEGMKNHGVQKMPDGKVSDVTTPDDTTESLVNAFNNDKPDMFVTSGHATERDWQIGYSYRNGQFRCRDGVLMGVDTQRQEHPIHSPNPKVYTAIGNCLMGHVVDEQAMALAFMGSGGVNQMAGYTVETWYGYGGWGINDYFLAQPGRFSLAESVYLANQALIRQLQQRFPETNKVVFNEYGSSGIALPKLAQALGVRSFDGDDKDKLGLMWDRDVVAFYGDPAWDARLVKRAQPWEQTLTVKGSRYTIVLRSPKGADCGRPPAVKMPKRLPGIRVIEGTGYSPVLVNCFVLLPGITKMEPGKEYRIVLESSTEKQPLSESQKALSGARPGVERKAVAFLIDNMPERDAATLKSDFILKNVRLALEAANAAPWGKSIPEDIFLNGVLPYANVTEAREDWRTDFRKRFAPLTASCKTPSEAALLLNRTIFKTLGVEYHATKRPKPDQNPSESIAAKYASCTGLCVLLADACRAVGVPARLVGTPSWVLPGETHVTAGGNHTWVEIWDNGWHFLGAAEESKLDDTWFVDSAKRADPKDPLHRIYAVSFRKTGVSFPMVWASDVADVYAEDVTSRYTGSGTGG